MRSPIIKHGYILVGQGRPALEDQQRVLGLHGVDIQNPETIWMDELEGIVKQGHLNLTRRNELIEKIQPGDLAVFSGVICLGVSPEDAGWAISQINERGGTVRVDGGTTEYPPGANLLPIIDAVRRKQRTIYQQNWRSKGKRSDDE